MFEQVDRTAREEIEALMEERKVYIDSEHRLMEENKILTTQLAAAERERDHVLGLLRRALAEVDRLAGNPQFVDGILGELAEKGDGNG